ncbi:MAG: ABC transporter ATP-binding protein [Rhodospirillales bacterium]|nr:ABC transporter ATP-binding protein [Rhodospirillales bacterium]
MSAALELRGVSKRFGGLVATREISLSVMPGERHLLIGPNGAGKTTLFNLITGDLAATSGAIYLFGADVTRLSTRARVHRGLARTYQVLTLFPHETLLHNVVLALLGMERGLHGVWRPLSRRIELTERALSALTAVGLAPSAHRIVGETAYGERRRLELAMALAQEPRLLLLDEPLAGLSREERERVRSLLEKIPRSVTVVMIEHDMDAALAFAERITLLDRGAVALCGTRAEVAADPRTREVYLGV